MSATTNTQTTGISNVFYDPTTGGLYFGSTLISYPINDFTFANLPTASSNQGRVCRVTDLNNALFESNGTRWKPVNGRAVIATLDSDWTGIAGTSEQIAFQKLIPANVIKNGDTLLIYGGYGKSGTSETTTIQIRLGTSGTTADTSILLTAPLSTTNISYGMPLEFTRVSATSIERSLSGATQNPFGTTTSALATPVAVSSMDANTLYITVTMTQSSTVETPTARRIRIELVSSTT